MTDEPYGYIKADKAVVAFTAEKEGRLRFKGGNMEFDAVVYPNQYVAVQNTGGSVDVKVKARPAKISKEDIVECLLLDTINKKLDALAKLFSPYVED